MSLPDAMQDFNMACMSDHGSVMDNLSFDDFDPSPGSLDFFEDFVDMDKMEESGNSRDDNVYAQLEQKEKDLILAAELGKALLEHNEELTKRQELMQQELAEKTEEVEQQKHHLRRRLKSVGGECESKLLDLQTEISCLHKELANQKAAQKTTENQKQAAVNELSEQNQRLVHKLKQAADVEEELNEHIQRLRGQVHLRRQHSLHRETTHAAEDLQKEVQRLSAKRGELEQRLHTATNDRDTLALSLKQTNGRCLMLEKKCRDLEQQLQLRDTELAKLRQVHNDTAEELDELRYQATLNASPAIHTNFQGNSLLSELGLEMTGPGSGTIEHEDDQLGLDQDDDIECDIIDGHVVSVEVAVTEEDKRGTEEQSHCSGSTDDSCQNRRCNVERQTLQDVLNEVHTTLSKLVRELKAFQVSSSPIGSPRRLPKAATNKQAQKEHLGTRPDEVRNLLRDLTSVTKMVTWGSVGQGACSSASAINESQIEALEVHIQALRGELCSTQAHIELLQAEINRQDDELKRKDSELCVLTAKTRHKLTQVLYSEVRSLEHELQLAASSASCDETDLSSVSSDDEKLEDRRNVCVTDAGRQLSSDHPSDISSTVSQDEIIDRLQIERDEAILRRSAAERELTQAKADMSKLDDQLIGAIKQKVSLSEQLDQWQIDIHQLLDQRLKKQLTRQEVKKPDSKKPKPSPQKRFPFWS